MGKCVFHPGRKSVENIGGKNYCEICKKNMEKAVKKVDKHVVPKACFMWYKNAKETWQPITGTGCAHWVAHQKNIKKGKLRCLLGYNVRVKDLVKGMTIIKDLAKVKKGDMWFNDKIDHVGLVKAVKVVKGKDPEITIQHDSSGQGKVATDMWSKRFKSRGKFYK